MGCFTLEDAGWNNGALHFKISLLKKKILAAPCSMWDLSSLTGDWTCAPWIWRQCLNHWTAREVPVLCFLRLCSLCSNSFLSDYSTSSINRRKCLLCFKVCFFVCLFSFLGLIFSMLSPGWSLLLHNGQGTTWQEGDGNVLWADLVSCNQLDFSLPWAEPPEVSGWNSEVK